MPTVASDSNIVRCPIFQGMSSEERQEVITLMERRTYPEGQTILREGRSIQILWVIREGRCRVVKTTQQGTEQELAVLEPGGIFGEMSFVEPGPHSASVQTLTPVEVLRLTRGQYDELGESGSTAAPKIAINIGRVLAQRLRKMDDWLCELMEQPEAANHREEWREFRTRLFSDWPF